MLQKLKEGKVRKQILSAMSEYGFFYIVDIPNYDPKLELKEIERFFNMSTGDKMSVATGKQTN